jgi:hypothetical protein
MNGKAKYIDVLDGFSSTYFGLNAIKNQKSEFSEAISNIEILFNLYI